MSEDEVPAPGGASKPELSRTERRELKKKKADGKSPAGKDDEDDEDDEEDLINPNHVTKKLNISDLGAPRELSRRERQVHSHLCQDIKLTVCNREQKEKKEAQERYWKVCLSILSRICNVQNFICFNSSIFKERQIRRKRTSLAWPRFARNAKMRWLSARLRLMVSRIYCL